MTRKAWIGITIIVLAIVLGGAAYLAWPRGPDTVRIGAILPLTGTASQLGKGVQQGIELALEEVNQAGGVNGKRVTVFVEDSKNEAKEGVTAFRKLLLAERPVAVISEMSSVSKALAPLATQERVVVFATVTASPDLTAQSDWVFRNYYSTKTQGEVIAGFIRQQLRLGRIGILHLTDDYGVTGEHELEDSLRAVGITNVVTEGYDSGSTEVRTQITKLIGGQVEAICIIAYDEALVRALTQIRELGYKGQVLTYTGLASPKVLKLAGTAAEGVYLSSADYDASNPRPGVQTEFVTKYQAKYGTLPDHYPAFGYDTFHCLIRALAKTGPYSEALRKQLMTMAAFEGAMGSIRITDKREVEFPQSVRLVKSGKIVLPDSVISGASLDEAQILVTTSNPVQAVTGRGSHEARASNPYELCFAQWALWALLISAALVLFITFFSRLLQNRKWYTALVRRSRRIERLRQLMQWANRHTVYQHEISGTATFLFSAILLLLLVAFLWAYSRQAHVFDSWNLPLAFVSAILSLTGAIGLAVSLRIQQLVESPISTPRGFLTEIGTDLTEIKAEEKPDAVRGTAPCYQLHILCYAPILGLISLKNEPDQATLYNLGFKDRLLELVGNSRLNVAIICRDDHGIDELIRSTEKEPADRNVYSTETKDWLDNIERAKGEVAGLLRTLGVVWRLRSISPTHLYVFPEREIVYRYVIAPRDIRSGSRISGTKRTRDGTEMRNSTLQLAHYARRVAQAIRVNSWAVADNAGKKNLMFTIRFDNYQSGLAQIRIYVGMQKGTDHETTECIQRIRCDLQAGGTTPPVAFPFDLTGSLDVSSMSTQDQGALHDANVLQFVFLKQTDNQNSPVNPSKASWPIIKFNGNWNLAELHPTDLTSRGGKPLLLVTGTMAIVP